MWTALLVWRDVLGKLSHATKFVCAGGDDDRGLAGCGGAEESGCCCCDRRVVSLSLTCGHVEVCYLLTTVDGMLSVWVCLGRRMK